jgi:hypothetical protein
LVDHFEVFHPREIPFHCDQCDQTFEKQSSLEVRFMCVWPDLKHTTMRIVKVTLAADNVSVNSRFYHITRVNICPLTSGDNQSRAFPRLHPA